jgi:hypothetical protein
VTDKVGLMIDLESLDTSPRSVITSVGIIAFPLDDPETEMRRIHEYLPAQPQIDVFKRTVNFDTILWWMKQEEAARKYLHESSGNDMEVLLAFIRSIHRKLTDLIAQVGRSNIEVWARGPQFDIVNLESLFIDCGLAAPWSYDSVMDLRTHAKLSGVKTEDIDKQGLTPHVAIDDCKLQIRVYVEALRKRTAAE